MAEGRYSLCIYIGSGEKARARRERYEHDAAKMGYIDRNGKPTLGRYIIDLLENNLQKQPKQTK